jgi:hypothetical protein
MKTKTVFETAQQWARINFAQFAGTPHDINSLSRQLGPLYEVWPGYSTKRWLFIYSPHSVNDLFEVGGGLDCLAAAVAKLQTVSTQSGMIFGVDASQNWGTKKCVITFTPLVICKAATSAPYDK